MIFTDVINKIKFLKINQNDFIINLPLEAKVLLGIFCCYSNLVKEAEPHSCMILSMVTRWSAKLNSNIYFGVQVCINEETMLHTKNLK